MFKFRIVERLLAHIWIDIENPPQARQRERELLKATKVTGQRVKIINALLEFDGRILIRAERLPAPALFR